MTIIPSQEDTLYIPIGRGVRNSNILDIQGDIFTDKYQNKYISVKVLPEKSVTVLREFTIHPPKPDITPNICLSNNERFCKWKEDGYIKELVNENIDLSNKDKITTFINIIKQIKYSYPRTKYEYTDEILEKNLPQDCLGYHGTLCSLLRCSNIPSVVDIGIRLTGNDKPHVWLWYYNTEENDWYMIDINDIKDNVTNPLRLSFTIGTTHNINLHTASYVQYFVSENMLRKELQKPHSMKIELVKRKTDI